ncbi:MAG: AAA family ATPase, partial [Dethiobacteria bacterium]
MSGRKVTFQKLILEGFGPYREATEFIFSESINSFVAENESGKTTMSAGLIAVLFGLSHRQKTNTPFNLGNFRNWENPARCY